MISTRCAFLHSIQVLDITRGGWFAAAPIGSTSSESESCAMPTVDHHASSTLTWRPRWSRSRLNWSLEFGTHAHSAFGTQNRVPSAWALLYRSISIFSSHSCHTGLLCHADYRVPPPPAPGLPAPHRITSSSSYGCPHVSIRRLLVCKFSPCSRFFTVLYPPFRACPVPFPTIRCIGH